MLSEYGCKSCAYIDPKEFGWPRMCHNPDSNRYRDEMDETGGCEYVEERDHCCGVCKWSDERIVFSECRNKDSDCYGLDVEFFDECKWYEDGCRLENVEFEEVEE